MATDNVEVSRSAMDLTTCWEHLSSQQQAMCRLNFQTAFQAWKEKGADLRMHVHHDGDINVIKAFLTLLVMNGFKQTNVSFDKQRSHVVVLMGNKGEGQPTLWFTFETTAEAKEVANEVAAEVLGMM